ncbi:MAG: hypothetical protein HA496_06480 [Thaumarchaeota archaeon]|nr:hypothetical protein [Nitrososphaerota archaeon]
MRKQSESILLGILLTAFMVSTIATPKMLVHFTVGGTAEDGQGQAGTTLKANVTATAYWTRTFSWTIEKSVKPDYWEFYPGGYGTSTYTITVTKDGYTDAYFIKGTVSVKNGGNVATENLKIIIELKDGVPPPNDLIATASVDVSSKPVLDPGETGEYQYEIAIPPPIGTGTYKITANVTITNHSGHLGEPYGPSPSATTNLPNSPTLINDVIHVDDTNGGPWTFSSSGSVTYDKTFTCEDEGTNENTATILETGQSASATVTVKCITPPSATISGVKYYDANLNGEWDSGEAGIAGWKIELYRYNDAMGWVPVATAYTGSDGSYTFTVTEAGTYRVVEVMPSGMWVRTAPESGYYVIIVELGQTYTDKDFGNVCLMQGTGGRTLGFWSNKNGQSLITSSDVTELNALNLYNPTGWTYPPFSGDLATEKTQIKNYLLNATGKDMRWMLSAQLLATKLNVLHSFLSGSTIVYVGSSTYVPSGFISIDEIMAKANSALSGASRAEQEYWKNLLDGLNNNRLPFVCTGPCYPIVYP